MTGTDADPQSRRGGTTDPPEGSVPIEILVPSGGETPSVEARSRLDIVVRDEIYPTARLADGRYVAWWHRADAPDPDDPAVEEWVVAPTRFLAAATVHELWEDPTAFESLRPSTEGDPGIGPAATGEEGSAQPTDADGPGIGPAATDDREGDGERTAEPDPDPDVDVDVDPEPPSADDDGGCEPGDGSE